MSGKIFTVIIPFLNEKYEVENTVRSIQAHSSDRIEIMLINDASDDGFDYGILQEKYKLIYIENPERLGVAASRDMGIGQCETPYFLLLDAHMRFYDSLWEQRIIDELERDKRTLLCCQTKVLSIEDGLLVEPRNRGTTYGACVEINEGRALIDPFWIFNVPFDASRAQTLPIVCVLGAAYACSKTYWQYLRGLEGLKYYGSDEPYISMKVWMEGGSCKLLKDVVIGHIYRTNSTPPYETATKFRVYNKLLMAELFFLEELKKELYGMASYYYPKEFVEAIYMLYDYRERIKQSKIYFKKIFTRNFHFFQKMNREYHKKYLLTEQLFESVDSILNEIAVRMLEEPVADIGLSKGRMGMVIFLFHYGRFCQSELYRQKAEQLLENLLSSIKVDTHYGLNTGLGGIGWGIAYLHQEGFVEGNIDEILEDFDKKIMEIDPERITNLSLGYGFCGIVIYLLARLHSVRKGATKPFDNDYLERVFARIHQILEQNDLNCDRPDVLLRFRAYYKEKEKIGKVNIFDVCSMRNPGNIPLQGLDMGLEGQAGIGLRLIFEMEREHSEKEHSM